MTIQDRCARYLMPAIRIKIGFFQMLAIFETDVRKLRHDPYELFTRMIQPILWLLIFGQAMAKVHVIDTGDTKYLDFIAPGILAQSILFASIFYGISLIWERDMGILQKVLVSPCARSSFVIGRALAAGIRGLSQAIVIYIIAFFLSVDISLTPFSLIGVVLFVFLGSALFSTISLIVASIVKKRERFMGVGQVLTMPLFFASNALYPIAMMPPWLVILSHFNPLTYQVDAFRSLMILGEPSTFGLLHDFLVLFTMLILAISVATRLYPKIIN